MKNIQFEVNKELTKEEAMDYQESEGYQVAGYGFYSYQVKDGKTTWLCSSSCD